MKTKLFILICLLSGISLYAQGLELKPYGFVKGDAIFSSKGVLSFGNPNLSSPQLANGIDESAFGFTAKHSRFGLKGSTGTDIKIGGVIEIDFFSTGGFDPNVNPRLRLAYASVAWENLELRFGQQWDLFSPLMPNTNNLNGFLWFGGNLGFRRGGIQLNYKIPAEGFQPMIQLAVAEAVRETGTGIGDDNKALFPMIQGRLSTKFLENKAVGVYFLYSRFSPNPDTSDFDYTSIGFGVDYTLPFHKYFEIHGEASLGTNLNNSDLFTIAGKGKKDDDRKSLSLWSNITSKLSDNFHLVVGVGLDKNQTDNLADGVIEQNFLVYSNLIFPITKEFSLALEVGNITTSVKGEDDRTAIFGLLSGKLNF
ncbi:hypothetical protein ASZ90_003987 [hydrocarbon metagenome]|uniref:Porin n=1 Tax=hydrocarbon metagenome TaxID=938273 RepID=A0A0W8FZ96_9ZZZZ